MVLGEVVCFHVAEEVLTDGKIDTKQVSTVGRLGDRTTIKPRRRESINSESLRDSAIKAIERLTTGSGVATLPARQTARQGHTDETFGR